MVPNHAMRGREATRQHYAARGQAVQVPAQQSRSNVMYRPPGI
jgi:hypothetical protein